MATPFTFKLRRGTSANWTLVNPLLLAGEPGLEVDTLKVKYGDGVNRWNDLPYPPGGDSGNISDAGLQAHINSPTPHPAYDDLMSLVVLYENAKV